MLTFSSSKLSLSEWIISQLTLNLYGEVSSCLVSCDITGKEEVELKKRGKQLIVLDIVSISGDLQPSRAQTSVVVAEITMIDSTLGQVT